MKRVKTGINGKRDADVPPLVSAMVTGATGKAEFDDCPISIVDLDTINTAAEASMDAEMLAASELAMRREQRKNAFAALRVGVAQFADFARSFYVADKEKLNAVGLDVVEAGSVGVLSAPQNIRAAIGKLNGTVIVRWDSVTGRDFFSLECATDGAGPWVEVYKGKAASATCSSLESGKEYFFRGRAWGSAGPGEYSAVTNRRAR